MKMKNILLFGCLSVFALLVITSCNKSKTPQELLKEENKAIEKFIDQHELIILSDYPSDGVFKDKEYFHDSNGLYIHVVDSGNGNKPKAYQTIIGRYDELIRIKSADTLTAAYGAGAQPDDFVYGVSSSYGTKSSYDMSCMGWAIAVSYVSEGAEVSLIIPSSLGSLSDQSNYRPVYYKSLKFRYY